MANLGSSIIYGNLDVKGNLTINGQVIGDTGAGSSSRLESLESASLIAATNIVNLQNSLNILQNNFNGYQGPLELQVTSTHIQWRKAGTTEWTNLVALSNLMPSITGLENQMNTFKTNLITEFTTLETQVINSLNVGITNEEIDIIISNALQ